MKSQICLNHASIVAIAAKTDMLRCARCFIKVHSENLFYSCALPFFLVQKAATATAKKKAELERRLQDVSGKLGSKAKQKKGMWEGCLLVLLS